MVFVERGVAGLLTQEEELGIMPFFDVDTVDYVRFFDKMITKCDVFTTKNYKHNTPRRKCILQLKDNTFCHVLKLYSISCLTQSDPEPFVFAQKLKYLDQLSKKKRIEKYVQRMYGNFPVHYVYGYKYITYIFV